MISTALRGAAVALLAVAATAVPAHADKLVITDAVGDVSKIEAEGDQLTPAGTQPNVDGEQTTVAHKRARIVVKLRFASVVANGDALNMGFQLRTDEGLKNDVMVIGHAGRSKARALLLGRSASGAKCQGLEAGMNGDTRTMTIRLPRRCVSSPRWIQVAPYAVVSTADGTPVYADDLNSPSVGDKLHYSKKVKVG